MAKISDALFSLDLTTLNFADEIVGTTSAAQPVTVTNNTNAPLTITTIVTSGDFAETNTCGNPLAVGDTCNIDVPVYAHGGPYTNWRVNHYRRYRWDLRGCNHRHRH